MWNGRPWASFLKRFDDGSDLGCLFFFFFKSIFLFQFGLPFFFQVQRIYFFFIYNCILCVPRTGFLHYLASFFFFSFFLLFLVQFDN